MAVLLKDKAKPPPRYEALQTLATTVGPALGISGIVIYGVLTISYEQFYSSLSVSPAHVGLGYGV